jgi:hypothetical protein
MELSNKSRKFIDDLKLHLFSSGKNDQETADLIYSTPVIHFGILGSTIIGLLFLCFVFLFSIWAKTAVLPVFLIALILPRELLSLTSFNEVAQLTLGLMLTYLLIGGYLLYLVKREKRKGMIQ